MMIGLGASLKTPDDARRASKNPVNIFLASQELEAIQEALDSIPLPAACKRIRGLADKVKCVITAGGKPDERT